MKQQNQTFTQVVKFAGLTGLTLASFLVVGCQTDESSMTDFFPADEARSTQNFMTAQAAAGARADATLQPMHFDGDHLNSLGEAKLDLMLKDDESDPRIVVFMNLPTDDEHLKGCRDSVVMYFEDRGVTKDNIEFKPGSNPGTTSLAAEHLSRLSRTESDGEGTADESKSDTGGATNGGTK